MQKPTYQPVQLHQVDELLADEPIEDDLPGNAVSALDRLRLHLKHNNDRVPVSHEEVEYMKDLLQHAEDEDRSLPALEYESHVYAFDGSEDVLRDSESSTRSSLPHSPKTPSPLRQSFTSHEEPFVKLKRANPGSKRRGIKLEQPDQQIQRPAVKNVRAWGRTTQSRTCTNAVDQPKRYTPPRILEFEQKAKIKTENVNSDDDEFEVEKIINVRGRYRRRQWLVRWKDFSARHDTWEPLENLLNSLDLIKAFENSHGREFSA